jgi:DNA oxidative demethylase
MHSPELFKREPMTVAAGAFYVPGWLSLEEQQQLLECCREWGRAPSGFVVPRMFDGTPLSIKSVYLGWYWHRNRYSRFADIEQQIPVKPFPALLAQLAQRAYAQTLGNGGASDSSGIFAPDSAIVNWYGDNATLGMHQDRGETAAVIARGAPVISISLGDSALFRFGNTATKSRPYADVTLASGDLFVFGGPSRMAYHGVPKVFNGTAPPELGPLRGRLNITIRETGFG